MTKIQLFKKLYIEPLLPAGSRVSRRALFRVLNDDKLVDEAIDKLYKECPTKFPGECENDAHYLLNSFWHILKHFCNTCHMCRRHPLQSFHYIWELIKTICREPRLRKYYMDPYRI